MKTFKDKFGDEVSVAQWFEDISISTEDDTGLSMFIFRATTAREIAAELIRIADVIEEEKNAENA